MNEINVVGIGPGNFEDMTIRAVNALKNAEIIVGYTVYVDLVREQFPNAKFITTPMKQEKERCNMAFIEAKKGYKVAMVCSGDPQVYAMAALMFEIGESYPEISVNIIGGLTAALSGGAVVGAPLNHDFALISLSDLLTPWEKIEKRLELAAQGDFVICLYNPASIKRADYLEKACIIVGAVQSEELVCAIVKNIGREKEESQVMALKDLKNYKADMFTTVFIGNSQTRNINGKMVTPRGYIV